MTVPSAQPTSPPEPVVPSAPDPCANTPEAPVITTADRNNRALTVSWAAVLYNTDTSPTVYYNDDISYQVWYAPEAETDPDNFALLGTSDTTSYSGQLPSANPTYNVYIKAVDTCLPANSSEPSNVITLTKKGSY